MPPKNKNVQAVLFQKGKFTPKEAEVWLKTHGYRPMKPVHQTNNFLRYRLQDPGKYSKERTIDLNNGIRLLIGYNK